MKPQCNTSADCLRELARVMDQFGISDIHEAVKSKYILCAYGTDTWPHDELPKFINYNEWKFAIAEVEGKPVFIGDELYDTREAGNYKLVAGKYVSGFICEAGYSEKGHGRSTSIGCLSWNPPKPATVTVELPYEVAEFAAKSYPTDTIPSIGLACKTALEKLK